MLGVSSPFTISHLSVPPKDVGKSDTTRLFVLRKRGGCADRCPKYGHFSCETDNKRFFLHKFGLNSKINLYLIVLVP